MVRKIICIAVVVCLGISIYAFAISSTVMTSSLVGAASGLGAAGLAILLARLGVGEWIDNVITGGQEAKEAEFARLMDIAYGEMQNEYDEVYGNKWAKWMSAVGTAFSGLTDLVVGPDVIKPIAQVIMAEYGLAGDAGIWLASKTPGYEISNTYYTVSTPSQWVIDLGVPKWITKARIYSARMNYMLSSTSTTLAELRAGTWDQDSSYYETYNIDGQGFYRTSGYNLYRYTDKDVFSRILSLPEYSSSSNGVYIGFGKLSGNGIFGYSFSSLSAEQMEVLKNYACSYLQGIRLASAWKIAGVPYVVKKIVALLHEGGVDFGQQLVPSSIPYAANDSVLVPNSITSEADMIDRAVNIVNNINSLSEYFVDSPRTLENVRVNPGDDYEIYQALGTIKYVEGVPTEWWVNGVKWADIVDGYVTYGGEQLGYVDNGAVYIYPDEIGTPDVVYTIGDTLLFTQHGSNLYMGGKLVGTRSGSAVTLFGHSYTADDTGMMVGGVKLLAGGANSVVTINILDMQTLANALNSTVSQLNNVANALNQGTAINNQVLGNTATTLDYVQSLHTKADSIISSLETAGASVSVDLSPIQLVLTDINSLVSDVASATAVLPALSADVGAIQGELTNLASMTVVLGDMAVNVSSVSNQLTDVASSVSSIGDIQSTLLSIQNSMTDVIESGLSSISDRITEVSSATVAIPGMAVSVADIQSQVSSIGSEVTDLASSSALWLSIYNQISSLSDSVTAVEGVEWSLPAVSAKVDAIDTTMDVVLGHTTGIQTISDQITDNASQSLAIWSEVQNIYTKVGELETQLTDVQEAIDLGTIEGLLTEEFGKTDAMRENYEKPLITDIMEDIGYTPAAVGSLADTSIWKKLFWFDSASITSSADALKLAASERFPFSIFTVVSDLNVSITDETVAIPFVIDLGEYGRYEMDWLNSDLANSFKAVFKPMSTLFIWAYFVGFLINLMPKVRID